MPFYFSSLHAVSLDPEVLSWTWGSRSWCTSVLWGLNRRFRWVFMLFCLGWRWRALGFASFFGSLKDNFVFSCVSGFGGSSAFLGEGSSTAAGLRRRCGSNVLENVPNILRGLSFRNIRNIEWKSWCSTVRKNQTGWPTACSAKTRNSRYCLKEISDLVVSFMTLLYPNEVSLNGICALDIASRSWNCRVTVDVGQYVRQHQIWRQYDLRSEGSVCVTICTGRGNVISS